MIPTLNTDRLSAQFATAENAPVRVGGSDSGDRLATDLLARFDAVVVDQTVERAAILEHDAGLSRGAAEAMVVELYVATDLSSWPAPVLPELGRTGYGPVVQSDGREYRKLDGDWYRYLYRQMERAKTLAAAGTISAPDWQRLRERFAEIHRFAALKGIA